MSDERILAITVPKWGMAMDEGTVTCWHLEEGAAVAAGDEVLDVESTKIANAIEAKSGGILRRQVADVGVTLPVGALLGVIAPGDVDDDAIETFVSGFVAPAVDAEDGDSGSAPQTVMAGERAIRYVVHGEGGEPVILVHGFGGDMNAWMFNQDALASDRAVYSLDLPGHGGSAKDVGDGGLGVLVAAVDAVMAETGADYTAGDYLIEALCRPGIYLVEGYANIMPPQANSLTGGQLLAAAAFLQTLGGEATIKGTDVESLDRFCNVAAGNVAADGSGATRAAAVAAAETGGFESADAIVAEFGCEACHNFEAPTRTLGPALLGVGGRLSKGELYEALLDPDATIPEAQPPFLKGLMKTTLTGNGFYKRMTPADYAMLIEWLSQK